jgi:hypothetical protein
MPPNTQQNACTHNKPQVVRVRFQHIALIASLAGGLSQHHDSLGVGLVDCVLEDVRRACVTFFLQQSGGAPSLLAAWLRSPRCGVRR